MSAVPDKEDIGDIESKEEREKFTEEKKLKSTDEDVEKTSSTKSTEASHEKQPEKSDDINPASSEIDPKELLTLLTTKDTIQQDFVKHMVGIYDLDVNQLTTLAAKQFKTHMGYMMLYFYIGAHFRKCDFIGKEFLLTFLKDFFKREAKEKHHHPSSFSLSHVFAYAKFNLVLFSFASDHVILRGNMFSFFYDFVYPMIHAKYPYSTIKDNTNEFYANLLILYRFDLYWYAATPYNIIHHILNGVFMEGETIRYIIRKMFIDTKLNSDIIIHSHLSPDEYNSHEFLTKYVKDYDSFRIIIGNVLMWGHFITVSFTKDTNDTNVIYFQIYDSLGTRETNTRTDISDAWHQAFKQVFNKNDIVMQFKRSEFQPIQQTCNACGLFSIVNLCILLKMHSYRSKSMFSEKYIELLDQLRLNPKKDEHNSSYLFLFYSFCLVKCCGAQVKDFIYN